MDFTLSEEQKMLQAAVRDFATSKLAPVADELEQAEEFGMDNFRLMAELGLTGMTIPTQYGGNEGVRYEVSYGKQRYWFCKLTKS